MFIQEQLKGKAAYVRPDKYPGKLMFDRRLLFPKDSGLQRFQQR